MATTTTKRQPVRRPAAKAASNGTTALKATLTFVRETKGTYVYQTDDDTAFTSTLYVRKASMPNGPADSITITLA